MGVVGRRLAVALCETPFGAGKFPTGFSMWFLAEGKSKEIELAELVPPEWKLDRMLFLLVGGRQAKFEMRSCCNY